MIDFDNMAVARTIYKLRRERGLSQEVFSGLVGMARSHVAMIENGSKQPNFETIWRIAVAFDLAPHELVERIEREAQTTLPE